MKAACAGLAVGRTPKLAMAWLSPVSWRALRLGSLELASAVAVGQSAARPAPSGRPGSGPIVNIAASTATQPARRSLRTAHDFAALGDDSSQSSLKVQLERRGAGDHRAATRSELPGVWSPDPA